MVPQLKTVRALPNGMEYSIHELTKAVEKEAAHVFPGLDLTGMLVVTTCQRSDVDLVRMGEVVEQEKDRLLERFMDWAKAVCEKLVSMGYWADYIDPCSGLPMMNGGQQVYSEVDGISALLGYKTANAGCCKLALKGRRGSEANSSADHVSTQVLLHPSWGSSVYPASMFTKAPLDKLWESITSAPVPE